MGLQSFLSIFLKRSLKIENAINFHYFYTNVQPVWWYRCIHYINCVINICLSITSDGSYCNVKYQ